MTKHESVSVEWHDASAKQDVSAKMLGSARASRQTLRRLQGRETARLGKVREGEAAFASTRGRVRSPDQRDLARGLDEHEHLVAYSARVVGSLTSFGMTAPS